MGIILENILTALLYLPFLVTPFALLIGYALSEAHRTEVTTGARRQESTGNISYLNSVGGGQAKKAA